MLCQLKKCTTQELRVIFYSADIHISSEETAFQINAEETVLKRKVQGGVREGYIGVFIIIPGSRNKRLLLIKEN